MAIHYLGVRHHGPGCARALNNALQHLNPDIILIEGPPEANSIAAHAQKSMQPPVAILVYEKDSAQKSIVYPFVEFSPEWNAIQWACEHNKALRFIDLPTANKITLEDTDEEVEERFDPIAELATAAGYSEPEQWWDSHIEQRVDSVELFVGINEAMTALRAEAGEQSQKTIIREAYMRQAIRSAVKENFATIVVVCGAWHVPALSDNTQTIKSDTALLKGLDKSKMVATWIPWSDDRLSRASGYGAGMTAPGWYRFIWQHPENTMIYWLTQVSRLLRKKDLDVSSASVIEAVRLADALAAMRGLVRPGLAEARESILTVLCQGDSVKLDYIRYELEIGYRIGKVLPEFSDVPLLHDLEKQQKSLRLKVSDEYKVIDLDLREENSQLKSKLFHQLMILNIKWATLLQDNNVKGTFRESWGLKWEVGFVVELIDASRYGNTIKSAAIAKVDEIAHAESDLLTLSNLLDLVILADLPEAIAKLLDKIKNISALSANIESMIDALPPLVRVARYGDVRKTSGEYVVPIITGLLERIFVGFPLAVTNIDEERSHDFVDRMMLIQKSVDIMQIDYLSEDWISLQKVMIDKDSIAAVIRGYSLRNLFDRKIISDEVLTHYATISMSHTESTDSVTLWLSGLLKGEGSLLLQMNALWQVIDLWVESLTAVVFLEMLPMLRKAFSDFLPAERRQMLHKVNSTLKTSAEKVEDLQLNRENAQKILPILSLILGKQ